MAQTNLIIPVDIGDQVFCITNDGKLRNEVGTVTELVYNVKTKEYTVTVQLDSETMFVGQLNDSVFAYVNEASARIKERRNEAAYAKMR